MEGDLLVFNQRWRLGKIKQISFVLKHDIFSYTTVFSFWICIHVYVKLPTCIAKFFNSKNIDFSKPCLLGIKVDFLALQLEMISWKRSTWNFHIPILEFPLPA